MCCVLLPTGLIILLAAAVPTGATRSCGLGTCREFSSGSSNAIDDAPTPRPHNLPSIMYERQKVAGSRRPARRCHYNVAETKKNEITIAKRWKIDAANLYHRTPLPNEIGYLVPVDQHKIFFFQQLHIFSRHRARSILISVTTVSDRGRTTGIVGKQSPLY